VAGPAWALQARGASLRGFDAALASSVPVASGLSSSAAVEIAAMRTFVALSHLDLTGVEMAQTAQRAENAYVGVRCGILDQFLTVLGQSGHVC